jgi:hypothetical protein
MQWLQQRREHYRAHKNDMCEAIEDLDDLSKLGQGFTSADPLEEVDIGDGTTPRPTFVNKNLDPLFKSDLIKSLKEYVDCFAWNCNEISGLFRDLVEHHLPIKPSFRPYKQPRRNFNSYIYDEVKEEVNWLLDAKFIRPCHCTDWIFNIVPVEKKEQKSFVFALILEILIKPHVFLLLTVNFRQPSHEFTFNVSINLLF